MLHITVGTTVYLLIEALCYLLLPAGSTRYLTGTLYHLLLPVGTTVYLLVSVSACIIAVCVVQYHDSSSSVESYIMYRYF